MSETKHTPGPWRKYAEERPTTAGVYEWRLPSEAVPGMFVTFAAHVRERGAGHTTALSPMFDYWDGYRLHVPKGTEWRECDQVKIPTRHIANLAVEGLTFAACPYCNKTPKLEAMQAAKGGGVVVGDNPHRFNSWWLVCCPWGRTPHLSDPRELEAKRRSALDRASADLRGALGGLLRYAERKTCLHEETHRAGFIWEICDGCGVKWADDQGGRPAWKKPEEITNARAALAGEGEEALPSHPGDGSCLRCSRVPVTERGFCNTCEEESAGWTPPRRIRADLWTPAEHAIADAVAAVEAAGAHPALTDAVVLLGQARERVADFVDAQMKPAKASPPEPCRHTGLCVRPKGHDGDHANYRMAPDLSTAECRDPHPSNPDIACTRPAGHAGTHQVDGYHVWWPATPEKAREA